MTPKLVYVVTKFDASLAEMKILKVFADKQNAEDFCEREAAARTSPSIFYGYESIEVDDP